jgi:hypothetical protein
MRGPLVFRGHLQKDNQWLQGLCHFYPCGVRNRFLRKIAAFPPLRGGIRAHSPSCPLPSNGDLQLCLARVPDQLTRKKLEIVVLRHELADLASSEIPRPAFRRAAIDRIPWPRPVVLFPRGPRVGVSGHAGRRSLRGGFVGRCWPDGGEALDLCAPARSPGQPPKEASRARIVIRLAQEKPRWGERLRLLASLTPRARTRARVHQDGRDVSPLSLVCPPTRR